MEERAGLGKARILVVSILAGVALGGAAVLFEDRGTFDCDSWVESCTVSWAIFWTVLILPWLTAVAYLTWRRSMTLLACVTLVASLSVGVSMWLWMSLDQATYFSQADVEESEILAGVFGIFLAVAYATVTLAVWFVARLIASRRAPGGSESALSPPPSTDHSA